ncbi:hypothetical protein B0H14DRAFT_2831833 [Mycena olivaceomarginata]|nr:hypothetical protein B0H14DRAFT_2831833 [Mycena olivaceomarginata]
MGTHKFTSNDLPRLQSYVKTSFDLLAFTQRQMMEGVTMNPPKGFLGNWIGVKKIMCHATLDITAEGGLKTPFVVYHDKDIMLIMEILDVKRLSWPEPGPKLQEAQVGKFGEDPGAPLVPMMQSPKIPLVAVRYSYMEGRPKGGAKFVTHLESRLRQILPPGTSNDAVRVELEKHLGAGEEMPREHIRMLARLLSHNADLMDQEWADDQQSHWNISAETKKETRVSFLRAVAVEEIETGKKVVLHTKCGNCGKDAKITMFPYCTPDCAKAQWPTHKLVCKISKKLASDPASLPKDTLYIPARAYLPWVAELGFASDQESVKMGGPSVYEPPRNQYGGERFMCRALLAEGGKGQWDPHQGKTVWYDQGTGIAMLHDRRRSVLVRFGPQEPAKARAIAPEINLPFHEAGYRQFAKVMKEKGVYGQLLYVWARRVGDCIEVDLKDIPNQQGIRWE